MKTYQITWCNASRGDVRIFTIRAVTLRAAIDNGADRLDRDWQLINWQEC
jgi:hypothetical protein